ARSSRALRLLLLISTSPPARHPLALHDALPILSRDGETKRIPSRVPSSSVKLAMSSAITAMRQNLAVVMGYLALVWKGKTTGNLIGNVILGCRKPPGQGLCPCTRRRE